MINLVIYFILLYFIYFDYCREEEAESVGVNKITDSWEDDGFYPIIEVSSG